MLLAVDVGNTNLTVGLFGGARLVRRWRISTDLRRTVGWYARRLGSLCRPEAVVCGSVVPQLDATLARAVRKAFGLKAFFVTPDWDLGLKSKVRRPRQVGADRLLNALALKILIGGPAIAIDFGTATTFDCIDADGDYIGGAILLGPDSAARALHEFTAKLPRVRVRRPASVVGKDTVHCLRAGLYFGYLGMVKEVLIRTKAEMGGRPAVVSTGGLAPLFTGELPGVRAAPDLTLHGLRFAHEISHHG